MKSSGLCVLTPYNFKVPAIKALFEEMLNKVSIKNIINRLKNEHNL